MPTIIQRGEGPRKINVNVILRGKRSEKTRASEKVRRAFAAVGKKRIPFLHLSFLHFDDESSVQHRIGLPMKTWFLMEEESPSSRWITLIAFLSLKRRLGGWNVRSVQKRGKPGLKGLLDVVLMAS
jgi:hypothetical protein